MYDFEIGALDACDLETILNLPDTYEQDPAQVVAEILHLLSKVGVDLETVTVDSFVTVAQSFLMAAHDYIQGGILLSSVMGDVRKALE